MSSNPVQPYAVLDEVKFKLNISLSDTSQDDQITVATNDSNNYIAEQTVVHAAIVTAGDDPSLSSMANNLAAAYFNFWISTEKDKEEIERWQDRIQQYILAKYGLKSANMLSGDETFGFTTGFAGPSSTTTTSTTGDCTCTASNLGGGEGVFAQKVTNDFQFKSLVEGANITLSSDANTITINSTASGTGDVVGPLSATDNAIVRFDTTTGKLIQDSGVIIDDSENITGIESAEFVNSLGTNPTISALDSATESTLVLGSNFRISDGFIDFVEISITPGAIPANEGVLYVRDESGTPTLFFKEGTTETSLVSGGASSLDDLTDVTITSQATGQVLIATSPTLFENGLITNSSLASGVFDNITGLGVQSQALDMGDLNIANIASSIYQNPTDLDPVVRARDQAGRTLLIEGDLNIENTDSVKNLFELISGVPTPANDTELAEFDFKGEDSGGVERDYAHIKVIAADTAPALLNGQMIFGVSVDSVNPSDPLVDFIIINDDLNQNNIRFTQPLHANSYIDIDEDTPSDDPAADTGRLFVDDDGGGTTTLFFRDSVGTDTNLLTGGGIASINADITSAQLIVGTTNQITVGTAGGTTTIDVGSLVVLTDQANSYTAGTKQSFTADGTTAGLNINTQVPSSPVAGDIWRTAETIQYEGVSATYTLVAETLTQTLTNKTLTTPTIASFTNAIHSHEDAAGAGQLTIPDAADATGTPDNTTFLRGDNIWAVPSGAGDVSGSGGTTDNAIVRWNGGSGTIIQDSDVIIDDSNNVTGINDGTINGTLTFDNSSGANPTITTEDFVLATLDINANFHVHAAEDETSLVQIIGNHTPATANDVIAEFDFQDDNDNVTPVLTDYAHILAEIGDPASGVEEGRIRLSVSMDGALTDFIILNEELTEHDVGILRPAHFLDYLELNEVGTPNNPAIDRGRFFAKDSGTPNIAAPFWIDSGGNEFDLREGTTSFPINFPEIDNGDVSGVVNIDFSFNTRHSQEFRLVGDTTLTFSGTTADTTEYMNIFIIQDDTGGWTLTLPVGTVNKAAVEAAINLSPDAQTGIVIRFSFGVFYAFIENDPTASSQTPWASNIDAAGFELFNSGGIQFNALGVSPGAGTSYIQNTPTGMRINVLDTKDLNIDVNGVQKFTFNATTFDVQGNTITDAGDITLAASNTGLTSPGDLVLGMSAGGDLSIEFNTIQQYRLNASLMDITGSSIENIAFLETDGTSPGSGFIRMDNAEEIVWENAGEGTAFFTYNASNHFTFRKQNENIPVRIGLFSDQATPENGDIIGMIDWQADTSAGGLQFTYGQIRTVIEDPTTTQEDAEMFLGVVKNGTIKDYLSFNSANGDQINAGATLNMSSEAILGITNLTLSGTITLATNTTIRETTTDMEFDVGSGGLFRFEVGGSNKFQVSNLNAAFGSLTNGVSLGSNDITNGVLQSTITGVTGITGLGAQAQTLNMNGNNLTNVPQILDSNSNELLIFTTTGSAVNEITLVNAATATPVEIQATGGDTDVDVRFVPKGAGTFYGNRETWGWPLTDETTAPTTGVKYTTEPAPYDMAIEDAVAGLTVAGTTDTFTIDVLKEDSVNSNTFTTIFSTLVTIDATEFTSTTAATPPVISVGTWEKGRRLQLSIDTLDTGGTARGVKIDLVTHATAK